MPRRGKHDATPGGMEQNFVPSCLVVMVTLVKVHLPFHLMVLTRDGLSVTQHVFILCQSMQDSGFSLMKCLFFSAPYAIE